MDDKTLTDNEIQKLTVGTQVKLTGASWPEDVRGKVVKITWASLSPKPYPEYPTVHGGNMHYSLIPSTYDAGRVVKDYSARLANNRDIGFEGTDFEVGDIVRLTGEDWDENYGGCIVTVIQCPHSEDCGATLIDSRELSGLWSTEELYDGYEATLVSFGAGWPHSFVEELCTQEPRGLATGGYTTGGLLTGKVHDSVTWTITTKTEDPKDYYQGTDVLDFIERHELGFPLGNAVKYISRAGKKPGQELVKDLKKAIDYIQFVIDKENENDR